MKLIGDICRNVARRLGVDLVESTNDVVIDSILDEDLCTGLTCVTARSGVGKTTFALDVVFEKTVNSDKNTVIFSCEKSAEQIVAQLVMKLCGLNTCFVNTDDLEKRENLSRTLGFLAAQRIYIESFEDSLDPTLEDIDRFLKKVDDVGLVMIDGLYCLWNEGKPEKEATKQTEESVKILKNICKKRDVPIVITTYFSRAEIKRMLSGDMSKNLLLNSGVDKLIVLYRSVVGTTISVATDFLVSDARGRYDRDTIYYDTKNRRFLREM